MEQETGRRPSRRAAREAAKKIYNTVRNYGCNPDAEDSDIVNTSAPKVSSTPKVSNTPKVTNTPRPAQRQRAAPRSTPRAHQNIKIPPPNIDLVMECHEELLSTVQAEALLQAQLQYNMVMKTLRSLKANNVRIICQAADEPVPTEDSSDDGSPAKVKSEDMPSNSKPNIVMVQAVKKENGSVYPMELSSNVPSPGPSILS